MSDARTWSAAGIAAVLGILGQEARFWFAERDRVSQLEKCHKEAVQLALECRASHPFDVGPRAWTIPPDPTLAPTLEDPVQAPIDELYRQWEPGWGTNPWETLK